ncbi:MAG TPA: hypothetical protein VK508_02770 [Cyclobacteriaceae bacterium]|nr:hypothetical protein [Cyclobacteriaceae bacterium]
MEKIDQLFERAVSFWPTEIDISDGKYIDEISGFKSENLGQAWNSAEHKSLGQDWNELSVWVIYKLLHQKSMKDFKLKIFNLHPSQLNKDEFKKILFEELQQEGYEQMLKELN